MAKRTNRVVWGLMVLTSVVFWGVFDAFAAAREVTERRNSQAELRRAIAAEIPKGTGLAAVLTFSGETEDLTHPV